MNLTVTWASVSKVKVSDQWTISALPNEDMVAIFWICASVVSLYELVAISGLSADAMQEGGT